MATPEGAKSEAGRIPEEDEEGHKSEDAKSAAKAEEDIPKITEEAEEDSPKGSKMKKWFPSKGKRSQKIDME